MKIRTSIAFAGISLLAFSTVQAAQMKQAFSYDAAGRLISVTTDGDCAQASLDERYVYDKSGNITEKVVNGETVRMTYDAANQLMSRTDADGTVDFVYDSAGRLVSEHTDGQVLAQYEYGYLDKVIQVKRDDQVTQFHYNARGMLVAKERDGQIIETFGWDGIGLLAKNETVYANEAHISGGVPLAAIDAGSENAEMQYFDSDYLGTTTAVYSASGEVDVKLASSFGAGTESGELRFTGKPYDADLDAHLFPYRNYKSEAGNWASADPAGFPDGPNQHYYAAVPTMGLDPLGLYTYHFVFGTENWERRLDEELLLDMAGSPPFINLEWTTQTDVSTLISSTPSAMDAFVLPTGAWFIQNPHVTKTSQTLTDNGKTGTGLAEHDTRWFEYDVEIEWRAIYEL